MQKACFGYVTCFDGNSDVCQQCSDVKTCQRQCYTTLRSLDPSTGDTKKLIARHERWARKLGNPIESRTALRENFQTAEQRSIQGMSRTASVIARALLHHFVDMRDVGDLHTLPVGYLQVLLTQYRRKHFVTRQAIDALCQQLGWAESTAKSYAAGFVEVLVQWKLVTRVKRGEYKVL
jgi:hypothetical protein